MIHCQLCSYRSTNYRSYVKHVFKSHSSVPNFLFTCGINGCSRTFRNYSSIKSHFSRHHFSELESTPGYLSSRSNFSSDELITIESDTRSVSESLDEDTAETGDHVNGCSYPDDRLQRSCALYLLTLRKNISLLKLLLILLLVRQKIPYRISSKICTI